MEIIKVENTGNIVQVNATTVAREVIVTTNPAVVGVAGKDFKYEDFTPEQLELLKGDAFKFEDFTIEQLLALKGNKGDSFEYSDFTPEQLELLKGDAFTYSDFTPEQLADLRLTFDKLTPEQKSELKGSDGTPFTFEMFTQEQLLLLKGEKGDKLLFSDLTQPEKDSLKGADGSGWTENYSLEADGARILRKVISYVGGVGAVPAELTANIGKYYAKVGGFTTVKADATDFKGVGGTVINDLTTGGTTTALSAEQGKVLNNKLTAVKTENILLPQYINRLSAIKTTGDLNTSTTSNVAFKVPVKPNTPYYANSVGSRNMATYNVNGDFIEFKINYMVVNGITSFASDVYFISYYLESGASADLTKVMLVESNEITSYVPPVLPIGSDLFERKVNAEKQRNNFKEIYLNENPTFNVISDIGQKFTLLNSVSVVDDVIDSYLQSCGIERMLRINANNVTPTTGVKFIYPTPQLIGKHYIYASAFLYTDDLDYTPTFLSVTNIAGITTTGLNKISTVINSKVIKIKEGLFRIDIVTQLQDFIYNELTIKVTSATSVSPITSGKTYRMSACAFAINKKLYTIETLLPVLKHENIGIAKGLVTHNFGNAFQLIEKSMRRKKWCLYGSSIEASGYFNSVAAAYDANFLNFGQGGSGTLWSNDRATNDTIFNIHDTNARINWSASWAEKEAYLISQGLTPTDSDRKTCYDQNLLTQLDADLFMIGTSGGNDRKNTDAFTINKTTRKYDRTTIYGAYCYVLRKLFEAKPTARVVIFGQHCFGWPDKDIVNEIQREVCKDWCIPFLDWGYKMGMSNEVITVGGVEKTVLTASYSIDGSHPEALGKEVMANFLIRALRDIV